MGGATLEGCVPDSLLKKCSLEVFLPRREHDCGVVEVRDGKDQLDRLLLAAVATRRRNASVMERTSLPILVKRDIQACVDALLGLFGVSYNIACICYEIRWRIQSRKRTHLACYRLLEKRGYDICQGWLVGQNACERHELGDYGRRRPYEQFYDHDLPVALCAKTFLCLDGKRSGQDCHEDKGLGGQLATISLRDVEVVVVVVMRQGEVEVRVTGPVAFFPFPPSVLELPGL
ncbi:hypothetical protein ARMGADRAFT_1032800 [Armillaria gallica]|uniref:Uncharacterized protein n=1 Tax=Armillaria gallica TaxID=47427 RepID=A0A2H3D826_ARMGA|nr:hypothetical protein ARMGADRAFT_1032800 [Armillaria gallica]